MNRVAKTAFESGRQRQKSLGSCLLSILAIAGMLLAVSLLSRPIPGVNEPHYLCKARSFSDPTWCDRDFFLQSGNAHYCFFRLAGPLTEVVSFTTAALIGRGISALMLAIGWTVLGRAIGLSSSIRVLAACAFAFLSQLGSFSGEWLHDGFESKVAAWGLGLSAVGFWIRGIVRTCPGWMAVAGICCGAGAMLHPVVGGWIAIGLCVAWLTDLMTRRRLVGSPSYMKSIRGIVAFSFATIVVALPGLVPALRMVLDDSLSRKDRELASFIQVFWRLKHHLDPTQLTAAQWLYAVGLLSLSIVLYFIVQRPWKSGSQMPAAENSRDAAPLMKMESALLMNFFLASAVIALAGVAIGWHAVEARDMEGWEWRAALLKFYPFRTFDALLPIVNGLLIAMVLQRLMVDRWKGSAAVIVVAFCGLPFVPATLKRETVPPGYTADQFADWQAACTWIQRETPPGALFLTPRESFAFKWMAERAEYVCYKDCPQDAAGILEWNRRLWWLNRWTLKSSTDGVYNQTDLGELRAETGCDFVVTRILGPFETAPVWQGKVWQVIKVPSPFLQGLRHAE
ncbi:MAG: DUF6798 domain-containing protein [Planctomycetaceae bacterium]